MEARAMSDAGALFDIVVEPQAILSRAPAPNQWRPFILAIAICGIVSGLMLAPTHFAAAAPASGHDRVPAGGV